MYNILGVFDTLLETFNNLSKRLQLPSVIGGIVLAVVGLAVACFAKRLTRAIRKTNTVADNDKVLITIKTIGLVLMFTALLVLVFAN